MPLIHLETIKQEIHPIQQQHNKIPLEMCIQEYQHKNKS